MAAKNYVAQYRTKSSYFMLKFVFSYKTKTGNFTFNESGPYPVYDGLCLFFPLEGNPDNWLKKEWRKATLGLREIDLYRGRKTEIKFNKQSSFLSNVYCPICLEQKSEYERHHCVARSDGGIDGYQNVLQICSSCHAHITRGCFEERWPKEEAALHHQLMYFDYSVYPREFRKIDMPELKTYNARMMYLEGLIKEFDLANEDKKPQEQNVLRKISRYFYQYYRDIGLGIRNWKKEVKLFPKLYQDIQKEFDWIKLS